ncbi:DUF3290 domain-containing protein [Lactobacillus sp. CC-MHH1034]|uniref:DUF3290 family protein n=1 Tax=Agrilactobacillus fermenti TaxID=2586909 RepID=UPI001E41C164|nr:DUF3290 family protein [Agrilactobacillus fermenti]MCD2256167.1 DUF3290 domain-containing protein [Agrilactobacillus fermenti]
MHMWTAHFFLEHETNNLVYLRFGLIIVSAVLLIISLIAYIRHRNNSKNRDMTIICILLTLLFVAIQTGHWQETRVGLNNSSQMVTFLKSVSQSQKTNIKNVATNQQNLSSGMIIKVNRNFYRVQFNNDSNINSYELTKTNLIDTHIIYNQK